MKHTNYVTRFLSVLMAVAMVLVTVLPTTALAADSSDDFYRIVHLDNGRKYFSKDWIIALINEMAEAGFNQLQLAFGNDGMRFLLDDMSVTVDGTTYSSAAVSAGIHVGNEAYYNETVDELTEDEMDEILAHAAKKGIDIVPHMNMPGHMDAILDAIEYVGISNAHFTGYTTSVRSLNLNNSSAVNFTLALLSKYVDYFAGKGCKFFHIGADEFANDAYYGSMGFPSMGRSLYNKFATFVNNSASIVTAAGMTPRAWNDGISYGSYSATFDTNIEITYWSSGWNGYNVASASKLANKGHGMINTNGDYYYILGVNDTYTSGTSATHVGYNYNAASGFNNTTFMGTSNLQGVGSMFCIWCDYPSAETETEVAKYVRPILRVMGLRMQNLSASNVDVDTIVSGGFNADGTINPAEPEHTHSYEASVVDATCTENGFVTYTCAECGDSYAEEIAALGHSYKASVTEPTCTAAGYTTYTCSACGDSYAEEIAALGHSYKASVTEPTCTAAGYTTYTCASCGDSYAEEMAALGHSYKAFVTEPTCTAAGYTTYTCISCGDSYVADETTALGHTVETKVVDATCEENGSISTVCIYCGEGTVEVIPALGHNYETETVEATCETDGGTVYTCTVCSHSYIADKVSAFGHNYVTTTVEATCEEDGSVTKTCSACGISTSEVIPALGHNYETVTVDATCEEDGSVTKTCSVCGETSSEVIPALGHDYETVTVDATCEEDGYVTTACANCDDSTTEVIPALGHDYETVTVDATCEEDGYVTTACANCDDSTTEVLPAFGHAYETVTVDATCTTAGYTEHTCSTCGDSYTSDQVAALGHNYEAEEVDNYMVYTCTACGDSYSESLAVNYTYDRVTAFTSGENYVITLYSSRKYYAVTHANNTLSVKQVTVSNGQITSEVTEDMLWTYKSNKLSYTDSNGTTYYMYAGSNYGYGGWFGNWFGSSTTLSLSTTNSSTVSFSSNRVKVGSNYLLYSSGKVSLNRSATTSYLFQQNEE